MRRRFSTRKGLIVLLALPILSCGPIAYARYADLLFKGSSQSRKVPEEQPCEESSLFEFGNLLRASRAIPEDEPIDITTGDLRFKVPHTYWLRRVDRPIFGCRNYWNKFGIVFWWPDLKPLAYGTSDGFKPKERGRTDPNASVIAVSAITNVNARHNADYLTPSQQASNRRRNFAPMTFTETEEFGLTKQISSQNNYPFIFYGLYSDNDLNLDLSCDARRMLMYQACSGHAYYKTEGIAFRLLFLIEELPNWRQIVGSTHALLKSWEVGPNKPGLGG